MTKGWYREPTRHSLASRGISTATKEVKTPIDKAKLDNIIKEAQDSQRVEGIRVGNFRVRERMNQHKGGRSTGHFGTGLYFYNTSKYINDNYRDKHISKTDQPIHKAKLCKNPLRLNDEDALRLHDVGYDMVAFVRGGYPKSLEYTNRDYTKEELKKQALEDIDFNLMLIGGFGDSDERYVHIKNALEKTEQELNQSGTPFAPVSHPMNHLIRSYGYDGIYPVGDIGASNTYGCVYFVEDFEERTGHKTKGSEDIPNEILK